MPDQTYCDRHPDTATNLRCVRCDRLICPQCMVETPVGYRCRECGKAQRLPIYDVPISHLARAIAASMAIGIGGGLLLGLIARPALTALMFGAALAGLGYLVAEGVSRVTNRKRGRTLQFVATGGMLIAGAMIFLATSFEAGNFIDLFDLLGVGAGIYIAFTRLR